MTDTFEVARSRLTPSLIDDICEAVPLNVRMTKVIANDSVLIRGKSFTSVEIVDSRFKGALTVIDCRFSGNVALKEVNTTGPISFINCEFGGDLTFFGSASETSICLIGSQIAGRVCFDGTSTPKLDVQLLSAGDFSIAAHEVTSYIDALSLDNISISGQVRIDSIAKIESMILNDCLASAFIVRYASLKANAMIRIANSRFDKIDLDHIKMNGARLRIDSTVGENVFLRNCYLNRTEIIFEQVLAKSLFSIKGCAYVDSVIDISSVSCGNLEIDQCLVDFLAPGEKKESAIFAPSLSDQSRLQTLKLLKDKFAREHRYDLEDDVFYLLKNLENRHRIYSCKWWKRPILYVTYFLSRFVMGWGVRLRNPLLSTILMIQLYSLVYYSYLDMNKVSKAVQYLGQEAGGLYGAAIYSLLAFSGQHADAQINGNVPIPVVVSEFFLGIAMTTIIVGILIRKLVR